MALNAPDRPDDRFLELLEREDLTLAALQAASFAGVPDRHRPAVWKLLLGYLPLAPRRAPAAARRAHFAEPPRAPPPPTARPQAGKAEKA